MAYQSSRKKARRARKRLHCDLLRGRALTTILLLAEGASVRGKNGPLSLILMESLSCALDPFASFLAPRTGPTCLCKCRQTPLSD